MSPDLIRERVAAGFLAAAAVAATVALLVRAVKWWRGRHWTAADDHAYQLLTGEARELQHYLEIPGEVRDDH